MQQKCEKCQSDQVFIEVIERKETSVKALEPAKLIQLLTRLTCKVCGFEKEEWFDAG